MADGTDAADPRAARQIVTDSWLGVELAREAGVPESATIRTSSPAMLLSGHPLVVPVERGVSPDRIQALARSTLPLTISLVDVLAGTPLAGESLTVARTALRFQTVILKALGIDADDLATTTAVVTVRTGSDHLDERFNPPWREILRDHPGLVPLEVPPERLPAEAKATRPLKERLTRRLRLESVESIGYRLGKSLADRVGLGGRRQVLVTSENPLLKEVAFHLMVRGMLPRTLDIPSPEMTPLPEGEVEALRDRVAPVIGEHLGRWVIEGLVPALTDLFLRRARDAVAARRAMRPAWRDRLAGEPGRIVLTNFPFVPALEALHDVCREEDRLLVSAQHGISVELNDLSGTAQAYYENNSCDVFLTFNERAAEIHDGENRFAVGRSVAVGLSRDYWRAPDYRSPDPESPSVFYISGVLYMLSGLLVQGGGPDIAKAEYELGLVDHVLSRLPHRVLFKPYPSHTIRYLDGDPIVDRALEVPNLVVAGDDIDLRYLIPDARLLIASLGFSTLGWCLTAERPFVYIEHPQFAPLRPEARAELEPSIFLFDASSPTMHDELRTFLSRPLSAIEAEWQARADARDRFRRRFIETGGPGAGARGARALLDLLEDR